MTATAARRRLTCPPLFGTARSPERPTLGPKVAEVAARLGKPPMPHQQQIFDVAFELDPETGLLAYSEVIVIGPRQATGKTELLLPVMTHRCVGFDDALAEWSRRTFGHDVPAPGPQRVLYTAQTADDARKKWRDIHLERLQASRFRRDFHPRLQQNMEAFVWLNGSMWSPGSTTGKTGGTGDTLDLGVIDEAWSREDARTELGMRPAMMTRPWRQLWATSMIPGLSRAQPGGWPWLERKRQVGRARVEAGVRRGTAFFDFSAAPGLDPADPETWWTCMPGLGHTVTEKAVREDFESLLAGGDQGLIDFCAEYLGWAPEDDGGWKVLDKAAWKGAGDIHSTMLLPGRVFAVDADPDTGVYALSVSGVREDGAGHIETIEEQKGSAWVVPRLQEIVGAGVRKAVKKPPVILLKTAVAAHLVEDLDKGRWVVHSPTAAEYGQACVALVEELRRREVVHIGQKSLTSGMGAAAKRENVEGGWKWDRDSPGQAPVIGATLARWGVRKGLGKLPRSKVF